MDTKTSTKPPAPSFFHAEEVGPRPWGSEKFIAHIPGVAAGKLLEMKAGSKGGLQKHHLKDESAYVMSGVLIFRYDDGTGLVERKLGPGEYVRIPPGCVHQEEAVTDVTIFEVGTTHFNDRVRLEEEYGLEPEGGLPSTTLEEVTTYPKGWRG